MKGVTMTNKELRFVAIDTVIKYAAEQGVKLRHSDFDDSESDICFVGLQPHYKNLCCDLNG